MKTHSKGAKTTGLHVFSRGKAFSRAVHEEWQASTEEQKEYCNRKAEQERLLATVADTPLDNYLESVSTQEPAAGPWQLCGASGRFAVHPSIVKEKMQEGRMKTIDAQRKARVGSTVLPDPLFPDTVPNNGPQLYEVPAAEQDAFKEMLDTLRMAIRYNSRPGKLLCEFRAGDKIIFGVVPHAMRLERDEFECEVMQMVPRDGQGGDLPMILMYEKQLQSTGRPWPCIYTEAEFVLMLTSHVNCVWQMYQLANEVSGTAFRRATERIEIQRAHLEELDRKRMENAAAMKILRMAAGLTVKSTRKKTAATGRGRGGARGGRGCRGRAGSSADAMPAPAKKVMGDDSSGGSSESEDHESEENADKSEPVKPPPDAPKKGVNQATHKAAKGERIIEWWDGRFPFARIERKGVHIGWGVTCALHQNANGKFNKTPCKKTLNIGNTGIDQAEAMLRLKRWLVCGKFHPLDPKEERQSHVNISLEALGSGPDEGDWGGLDDDIDMLVSQC